MKKFTALLLALTLALSLAITVSAETITETGTKSEVVTGSYIAGSASTTVYSIDIAWGELSFTYTAGDEGMWDPDSLTYTEGSSAFWSAAKDITITNRSNAAITVSAAYTANTGFEDVLISFNSGNAENPDVLVVDSADTGAETGTEQKGTITVTPSGTMPEVTGDTTIGTITLTIE